eukprot:SM000013S26400  [mRNA]  locus=s13:101189:103117:- [translate_table: standard]
MAAFADALGLRRRRAPDGSLGIWDGARFVLQTAGGGDAAWGWVCTIYDAVLLFWRYGLLSMLLLQDLVAVSLTPSPCWCYVDVCDCGHGKPYRSLRRARLGCLQDLLELWMHLYDDGRPGYATVESLLRSVELFDPTMWRCDELLLHQGLPVLLIAELVTVRIERHALAMLRRRGCDMAVSWVSGLCSHAAAFALSLPRMPAARIVALPSPRRPGEPEQQGGADGGGRARRWWQAVTRIQYGQSTQLNALACSVALVGTGGELWAVEGGNWKIPAGLVKLSNASLHLSHAVRTIRWLPTEEAYSLTLDSHESYSCNAVVLAAPLEEAALEIVPAVSVPKRSYHHMHVTFVRGFLHPGYFGLKGGAASVPDTVATTETAGTPFQSISNLRKYGEQDFAYKLFSEAELSEDTLDQLFSKRNETVRLDWAAYPEFHAPEQFAPFLLDDKQLYYVNAFENAASAMETAAVAANNVVKLLLSRLLKPVDKQGQAFDNSASGEVVRQKLELQGNLSAEL